MAVSVLQRAACHGIDKNRLHTTPHYTTLHYTTLQYNTIHYNILHYTTLHYKAMFIRLIIKEMGWSRPQKLTFTLRLLSRKSLVSNSILELSDSEATLQSAVVTICTICFNIRETLHSAHTMYLCVPYDLHNKQRLFL
jgi:hypothetical protein